MLDGPTEATDLDKTEANKQLVAGFVDDILVHGRMKKLAGYFYGDRYVQHNPAIADGLSGLGQALQAMAHAGVTMKYDRVHNVLSEGGFAGKPTTFYDLFRVQNGRIAERRDVIEPVPARDQWRNANGKF
ncbi:hypothetical protein OV208_09790 [Corallococcus sp. bb12-1]|uniref:nuclear transport factor 2 family protein n=1 Tax=Corallococcus sp. bb12-1 TaxID=2996784 RepID=UPI00226F4575|nr:hypothetical protein [Corallococcus sp. bb12-1]MCY1041605.1 hypothetical protein [Corallococcus sp. bb12-1]